MQHAVTCSREVFDCCSCVGQVRLRMGDSEQVQFSAPPSGGSTDQTLSHCEINTRAEQGKLVTLSEADSPPHTLLQSHSSVSLSASLFTVYVPLKLCLGCCTSSETDFVCLHIFSLQRRSADILFVSRVNTPEEKVRGWVSTQ